MFRIVLVLAVTAPALLLAGRIQRVNLSPEEAQTYITQQSLDLRYAKKLGEHPLGYFRNIEDPAKAKFFHNGRLIDNPEDFVEEVYEANQFHGQDGLGRAMFGYTDHNQARLEARNANGEVRGSYQYIDPFGQEVIVQYWSDGLGFHQVDNRPEVKLEPVTDTPEVREARIAHLKAWEEAANLARSGTPTNFIKPIQNTVDDEEDEIVGALSNQHQSLVRYPTLPYTDHIAPVQPIASDDAVVVEAVRSLKKRQNGEVGSADQQEDEPQYDPKGFFYSFEYPVYTIAETEAAKSRAQKFKRSNPQPTEVKVESEPLVKTVSVEEPKPVVKTVEQVEPQPEDNRVSLKAIQTGEQLVAAVHDVQVSPKQKLNSEQ